MKGNPMPKANRLLNKNKSLPEEDNLDNLLDDLLKEDLTSEPQETILDIRYRKSASPSRCRDLHRRVLDNLDGLLDDLITGDTAADATKKLTVDDDTGTDASPSSNFHRRVLDNLDGLLDDLITDDITADAEDEVAAETTDTEPATEDAEEEDLDDILNDLDDEKEDEVAAETTDTEPATEGVEGRRPR